MATAQLGAVVRHIRDLAADHETGEQTDGALLRAFLGRNDQPAFETLMLRHGPMVLRVCWRTLGNTHDAEDALQATFLVLARRAASIRKTESLASWLHGVAYRMATDARKAAARRHKHESRVNPTPPRDPALGAAWQEFQVLLDEQIVDLPEILRTPFVLCCLENKSCAEVGQQLDLQEATVRKRLSRARKLIQERLTRRGVSLTAVLTAVTVGANSARAVMSRSFVASTAKAAAQTVAGQVLAWGLVPARVAALVKGANQAMFLNKCKSAILLLFCVAFAGAGLGLAAQRFALAEPPPRADQKPREAANEKAKKEQPTPAVAEPKAPAGEVVAVRGRVLDPDGKPFAGARLYLAHSGPEQTKSRVRATSGADGRFAFNFAASELDRTYFDNPTAQVIAVAKGHGFDVANVGASGKAELTLRLVKDVPLKGRILDQEGKPVPGATVRVADVRIYKGEDLKEELADLRRGGFGTYQAKGWNGPIPGQPMSVTTGADGRFRLEGIGRERMAYLKIEGPGIQYTSFQVMTRVSETVVSPNTSYRELRIYGATFDYLTAASRSLRGVVRDKETGKPVAGARVESSYTTHAAHTDKDGRYELLGYPKSREYRLLVVPVQGQPYFMATANFPDTPGLTPLEGDILLVRGIPVRGRVTDKATGKPIRGARIDYCALYPNPNSRDGVGDSCATTGLDGSYAVVALPGPGLLAVTAAYVPQDQYMSALVTPREMKAFYKNWADPGGNTDDLLTVSAGGTMARGLVQENYHALVLIEPEAKTDKLTRDVALQPARTLKGSVTGPDGKPLAGVTVFGLGFHHFGQETLKSANFTVAGLNPRRSRKLLFLHKEKGLGYYQEIRGDDKGPLAIKLQPTGSTSGRIVDKDGQPMAGIILNMNRFALIGPGGVQVKTGQDGRFRAGGLVPGQKYQLSPAQRSLQLSRGGPEIVVESGKEKNLGDVTAESGN